jgi:hypothetical protein
MLKATLIARFVGVPQSAFAGNGLGIKRLRYDTSGAIVGWSH